MGLEDDIEVTDDVGEADVILASSSELIQNPSISQITQAAYICHQGILLLA